ncbi:MAG: sigma 54-interacting transcriptional regulator [Planctomycetota bacterium]
MTKRPKARPSKSPTTVPAPQQDSDETLLRRILEGTARATGDDFFRALVRNLSLALRASHVFVSELLAQRTRVRTLALWGLGAFHENFDYDLDGTPCEDVIRGSLCHHPRGVADRFPRDEPLRQLGIQSYLGVPLLDQRGQVLGHLAVLDTSPMPDEPQRLSILDIFAARASAELERLHAVQALAYSERQFRDLFDEAPIGYVYEDTNTRFKSANRAAQKILGLRPDEVEGTVGLTLVANTTESQLRLHDSMVAEQAGREKDCIEIELRRKCDQKPVWIQRWSRPEPDGKLTRTMIIDITDRVLAERERNRLRAQNVYLREEIKSEYNFDEIVGSSPSLRAALVKVEQVAPTDSTVLILGETGTGKELIARALHNNSRRREGPLIKLNCAALPTGLIESELFGHTKGAFTGATESRTGRFALADGGTIFLDEVGDIPKDVQVRLLRVLQEQEFEPVGSQKTIRVDVRVIAATNRDLAAAVADGSFRADLFYRLNVFPIHVPPLRERRQDIRTLAHYFAQKYATRIGKRIESIAPDTLQRLDQYPWPGNIRELENLIERAVIVAQGTALDVGPEVFAPTIAPPAAAGTRPASSPPPRTAAENERQHVLGVLERCNWIIEGPRGAATVLGLHPNTLRSRMKKLDIHRGHEGS